MLIEFPDLVALLIVCEYMYMGTAKVKNVGKRKHWRILLFRLFGGESFSKMASKMKYRYGKFRKFERENFGN